MSSCPAYSEKDALTYYRARIAKGWQPSYFDNGMMHWQKGRRLCATMVARLGHSNAIDPNGDLYMLIDDSEHSPGDHEFLQTRKVAL